MNHYSLRCATTYLSCYAVTAVTLPNGLSYFAFDTLISFVLIINDYCLLFFLMMFVTPGCSGDTMSRHMHGDDTMDRGCVTNVTVMLCLCCSSLDALAVLVEFNCVIVYRSPTASLRTGFPTADRLPQC